LHVTLYEFCTYLKPVSEVTSRAEHVARELHAALRENKHPLPPVNLRIRQLELLPSALIAYADFLDSNSQPIAWLDHVRRWCEQAASHAVNRRDIPRKWLNSMRVPFPAHVTLWRFDREVEPALQSAMHKAVIAARYSVFAQFPVRSVDMTIARKTPYRDVQTVGDAPLRSWDNGTQ
jgi:hypothetical protein